MQLSIQQKKKIAKLQELGKAGNVALLKYLFELEEKIDAEIPEIKNLISRLRGEKGDEGKQGPQGTQGKSIIGIQGIQGERGIQGVEGEPGRDGRDGIDGVDGQNGRDGKDGHDGKDGKDGSFEEVSKELKEKLRVLDRLPDLERVIQANAMPVTTTFFSKNGQTLGRAKNINFVEGANTNLSVTISGDTANVTVKSTGGGGSSTFVNNEIVSGSGTSWTLAQIPLAGTQHIVGNGQRLTPGAGNDYTISGTAITTVNSYSAGTLLADYQTS